ncbi:hypothetical protein KP509_35G029300 [Ceratopteris richardii]|uniref:ERCC4 domain-containing protein n=1 Tax=Ceratopteris richardii TaxID=49495 RepID=A0A8T2QFH2_CERRI|nr:hypothetical protein KP509_35G029300 [Ceratopteris richardii]
MKDNVPPVELVMLSDSLTSPMPKPKTKSRILDQGAAKVVCLDSDTESDGSFMNGSAHNLNIEATHNGTMIGPSDEYKRRNERWCGLHSCSNYGDGSFSSHQKNLKLDIHETSTAVKQDCQRFDDTTVTVKMTSMQAVEYMNDLSSLSNLDDKDNCDHMNLQPQDEYADVFLYNSHSSPSSNDKGCRVVNFQTHKTTSVSTSPCSELRSTTKPCKRDGVEHCGNYTINECSPSNNISDGCESSWDNQLKGFVSILATSNADVQVDVGSKPSLDESKRDNISDASDEEDYEDYSFLKKRPKMCSSGANNVNMQGTSHERQENDIRVDSGRASDEELTTYGKNIECSRIRSTKTVDKEILNLKKREKQIKDRAENNAKKQQLKMEKEILRQQKLEERKRQQELKKQRNEEERRRKEELKAKAVERRKIEKEREKWVKGKFALQNITALIDTEILEGGLIGGHLLTRFAEKGFKYRLVRNPVKKTVIWQMKLPSKDSPLDAQEDCLLQEYQEPKTLPLETRDVSYVLIVLEANEFLEMITEGTLEKHIMSLQKIYPGFILCYLINKLMWFLNKREQKQYKTPGDTWIRPPVEQVQNG